VKRLVDELKWVKLIFMGYVVAMACVLVHSHYQVKVVEFAVISIREYPDGRTSVEGVDGHTFFFNNGGKYYFHVGDVWRVQYSQNRIMEAYKIGEIQVVGASQ
jgi:hypothetical protein